MKTLANIIGLSLVLGLVTTLSAQRANQSIPNKTYHKADKVEVIKSMKVGDRYALVCRECDTVTIKEIAAEKESEALCHDGGTMHCESCKKKFTINTGNRAGGTPVITKVTIVNAEGKECMFIVPLKG